ncbi:serine/threonine-protein kinase [Streptosporangium sp. KLBMP 9127]|nr:serine/threonine-protein kinase [Streptosporangium sp. KLBMP 9127]
MGSFRLSGRIGEGGQGVVFLGVSDTGERAAIKLLHVRFSGDTIARSRFARELRASQRVASFCTAKVIGADLEGDVPYIASEYIDGRSLRDVVDSDGPLRGPALERLAVGTATALTAIHHASIVHRDFKPDNVLIAADGPRVVDFGIARIVDSTGTITSRAIGTPAYMAPEQIAGDEVGPFTDVFAWGATIAFAATGETVFEGSSIAVVLNRILNHEVDVSALPEPLRSVVRSSLAKPAASRPSADQILLRLLGHPENADASPAVLTQGVRLAAARPVGDNDATRLARLPVNPGQRTTHSSSPVPLPRPPDIPPPSWQTPPPTTRALTEPIGRKRSRTPWLVLLVLVVLAAGGAGAAYAMGWRPAFLSAPAPDTTTDPAPTDGGPASYSSVVDKAAGTGKLTIGMRDSLPGIALMAGDKSWAGFEVDLATEIAEALGVPRSGITFRATSKQERPGLLDAGEVDLVISTYAINDVDQVSFAGPYYLAHVDVLVKDGSPIVDAAGLEGRRLCQPASSLSVAAVQRRVKVVELVPVTTYSECVDHLLAGRVDAIPGDDLLLAGFANRENIRFKVLGLKLTDERYAVALKKGDEGGCTAVRAAVAGLYADGTIKTLLDKHFSKVEFAPEEKLPAMQPCG